MGRKYGSLRGKWGNFEQSYGFYKLYLSLRGVYLLMNGLIVAALCGLESGNHAAEG
ncbi:hypothetical protein BJX63DRAFT_403332 [Aspergillus granulosus]|uniref:Uncharacterized protein n=1 Tax=Aspergillus granulosus TaxID=176169 RepID=A0ABR4H3J3_9EURO